MDLPRLRAEQAELRKQGIYRGIGVISMIEITNPSALSSTASAARGFPPRTAARSGWSRAAGSWCCNGAASRARGPRRCSRRWRPMRSAWTSRGAGVITGDTDATPYGGGTWASRGCGGGRRGDLAGGPRAFGRTCWSSRRWWSSSPRSPGHPRRPGDRPVDGEGARRRWPNSGGSPTSGPIPSAVSRPNCA